MAIMYAGAARGFAVGADARLGGAGRGRAVESGC